MVLSKLDLTFAALLVAGLLWVEHGNRVVTGSLAAARDAPATVPGCPATDDIPFSADCIRSIDAALPATIRALAAAAAANHAASADAGARTCAPGNRSGGGDAECLRSFPDGASRP